MAIPVDTNILVRAVERNHPMMRTARLSVRALVQKGEELCVTPQNIAEFWNVCTRPANLNGLGNSIAATTGWLRALRRSSRSCRIRCGRSGYGVIWSLRTK